ncbi:hypothetical protein KDK95_00225 [Actinospica sp. MGRD01-02]|uniref:Uncharacterized protein n=1 Tax=Actinospica acidithermotolerans TaxID=2828514 RepID=A0A941E415_9ACTN|nr:hypothetical protein [Actinospica acidithermotolerans]
MARYVALRATAATRSHMARPMGIDPFLEKIEELVERSKAPCRVRWSDQVGGRRENVAEE